MAQRPSCELCPNRKSPNRWDWLRKSFAPKLTPEQCSGPRFVVRTAIEFDADSCAVRSSPGGHATECRMDPVIVDEDEQVAAETDLMIFVLKGDAALRQAVVDEARANNDGLLAPKPSLPVITRPTGLEGGEAAANSL